MIAGGAAGEGLLIPVDVSGMQDQGHGSTALDDKALLQFIDSQVRIRPSAPPPLHPGCKRDLPCRLDVPAPASLPACMLWTQVLLAIRAQVMAAKIRDDMCTVLHIFRDFLFNLSLPRPLAVQVKQALKDAERETIRVNDLTFVSDPEAVQKALRELIAPLACDADVADKVCSDILRASSRTASGGDAYAVVRGLLATDTTPLTPTPAEQDTIDIKVR